MGFMDKIKDIMGATEDDYYEQDYDFESEENQAPSFEEVKHTKRAEKPNKVVNINSASNLQVVLVKPESFQEATTIADHLNSKHTVVLNLETTDREEARRLVDFLSGAAYANNGQLKRVANNTFIITPYNVDVMGDLLLDKLDSNSGMYF
jgi:cell division inhibitor SepF